MTECVLRPPLHCFLYAALTHTLSVLYVFFSYATRVLCSSVAQEHIMHSYHIVYTPRPILYTLLLLLPLVSLRCFVCLSVFRSSLFFTFCLVLLLLLGWGVLVSFLVFFFL